MVTRCPLEHLPWVRITLGESLFQVFIVPVNIVKELNLIMCQYHGRGVKDQDRNGLVQIDLHGFGTLHGSLNAIRCPVGLVAQHPFGERQQILHANAAMAEVSPRLANSACAGVPWK